MHLSCQTDRAFEFCSIRVISTTKPRHPQRYACHGNADGKGVHESETPATKGICFVDRLVLSIGKDTYMDVGLGRSTEDSV